MKINKRLLAVESGGYAALSIAFLVMYFLQVGDTISSWLYTGMLLATFGYFYLIETWIKKWDSAVHYKAREDFYKPTGTKQPYSVKRKGIVGAIVLWLLYLAFIAVLRYLGILNWQLFCAGACFMFFLNTIFTRKLCFLSLLFLHNKNNCCKHCGINGWDGAIFASALIFAPHISIITTMLNWLIIAVSFAKLIEWEYLYHKYPFRFYPETNQNLSCKNCIKRCQYSESRKSNGR